MAPQLSRIRAAAFQELSPNRENGFTEGNEENEERHF
jgi:hypothetical protein